MLKSAHLLTKEKRKSQLICHIQAFYILVKDTEYKILSRYLKENNNCPKKLANDKFSFEIHL